MADEDLTADSPQGFYLLRNGDDPRSVAEKLYKDGNKYAMLLAMNPQQWKAGDVLVIPHVKGRSTLVAYDGEPIPEIIKRLFPNQPVHLFLDRFLLWNGDGERMVGDMIFCPNR